jgi:hypothetical protein
MRRSSLFSASLFVLSSFAAMSDAQGQSSTESDRIAFGNLVLRPISHELLDDICLNSAIQYLGLSEITPGYYRIPASIG